MDYILNTNCIYIHVVAEGVPADSLVLDYYSMSTKTLKTFQHIEYYCHALVADVYVSHPYHGKCYSCYDLDY